MFFRLLPLFVLLAGTASAAESSKVRLLYSNGVDFRISINLNHALEKTLRED